MRPGTLRGLVRATVVAACGRGWTFAWGPAAVGGAASWPTVAGLRLWADAASAGSSSGKGGGGAGAAKAAAAPQREWYVAEADVAFFEANALAPADRSGGSGGDNNSTDIGGGGWEPMLARDVPGVVRYAAWRRALPNGATEYRSVTVAPDAAPREVTDLYLDDSFRRQWDGMVIHHEVLEHGDFAAREQVVRWVRRFPFAFLSDREYVIARRVFLGARSRRGSGGGSGGSGDGDSDDDVITVCTKAVEHPRAPRNGGGGGGAVRMGAFYSHWRSRRVACPWGSGRPATETVLLHHERFNVSERLARFAVAAGMWGFVRRFAAVAPQYVAARRRRCAPDAADPAAFGAGFAPNPPPLDGGGGDFSCSSGGDGGGLLIKCAGFSSDGGGSGGGSSSGGGGGGCRSSGGGYRPRRRRLPAAAAIVLAGGVALAVGAMRSSGGGSSGDEVGARLLAPQRPAGGPRAQRKPQRERPAALLREQPLL